MKLIGTPLIAATLLFLPYMASGQLSGAVQRTDALQEQRRMQDAAQSTAEGETASELYAGEASDVGPQSVLRIKPRTTHFEGTADMQYFYTDNMFLSENGEQSADILVSTVQFALAPAPYALGGGRFAPRIGYRHQWFNFGLLESDRVAVVKVNPPLSTVKMVDLDAFDFNAQTAFLEMRWLYHNWVVEAGFDFNRLLTSSDYDEFYTEYVPHIGVRRLFQIDDRTTLSLGYTGNYRFTETDVFFPSLHDSGFDDRTDHAFQLFSSHELCEHAVLQPYYQFKYTHFTDSPGGDRNDYLHSVGLALYWIVGPNLDVRSFVGYNTRASDNGAVDEYDQFDIGAGFNISIRF